MKANLNFIISIIVAVFLVSLALFGAYVLLIPKPDTIMNEYLNYWRNEDIDNIYSLLTRDSQLRFSTGDLQEAYHNFFTETRFEVTEISKVEKLSSSFGEAEMTYTARLNSRRYGELELKYYINYQRENLVNWRIDWKYSLVHPQLKAGQVFTSKRHMPERGSIYDRSGKPLALKTEVVIIGLQPGRIEDEDYLTAKLEEFLDLDPELVKNLYQRPGVQPHWFVPIKTVLLEEYERVNPSLRPIPGVFFRRESKRIYPAEDLLAHIIGYTGEVNQEWINSNIEADYREGDLVGKEGLEIALEQELRGTPGYSLLIKEDGFEELDKERLLLKKEAVRGSDFYLTLDLAIQKKADETLGDKKGAMVIIDPRSGGVLALLNKPSFNPNLFALGMTATQWEALRFDPDQAMFNRALSGLYPPGSVMKIVTTSAALDTGIVTPVTSFTDQGEYYIRGNIIRNFQNQIHGEHNFKDAVTHSINTTFAKIGLQLGKDKLKNYAERYGLENKHDFTLPVATSTMGEIDSEVELAWSTIGQSEVLVTPFEMAKLISSVAAKGIEVKPTLLKKKIVYHQNGESNKEVIQQEQGPRIIKEETAATLISLLQNVVENGTGKPAKMNNYTLAGKTGTAEFSSGSEKSHAWFVCFSPIEEPVIALSIFVEGGGSGGQNAAPLAHDFLQDLYDNQLISPTIDDQITDTQKL